VHDLALAQDGKLAQEAEARRAWHTMIHTLFAPRAPLHAATWDGLCYLVRHCRLEGYELPRPRPGAPLVHGPREAPLDDPPALRGLPDALRLLVHARELETPALMLRLYEHAAWTDAGMAEALSLTEGTIKAHRDALVRAGHVTPTAHGFTRAGL